MIKINQEIFDNILTNSNTQEKGNGEKNQKPKILIDEKMIDNLVLHLNECINCSNCQELSINIGDYYLPNEERMISIVNEISNSIMLSNINLNKFVSFPLAQMQEIPNSHSLIVTPKSQIFLSGGIYAPHGFIAGETFYFDSLDVAFQRKMNMQVKRVGHSLVYCIEIFFIKKISKK